MKHGAAKGNDPAFRWETELSLITNRDLVATTLKVVGLSVVIMGSLLTLAFATQGEWKIIGPLWALLASVGVGLALLALLVMLVVFRNRMRVHYTVGSEGVVLEIIDPTARRANRAAIVLGALAGRMQPVGAGLIGVSREQEAVNWNGAFRAAFDDGARTVTFANAWRRLMVVQCTPGNYDAVAAFVRERMAARRTASRVPARSPLAGYLGWTAAVVLASVPSFLVSDRFAVSLLLPILLLCFAVATVWLVPFFGYVVIGVATLIVGSVALTGATVYESAFRSGARFMRWTVWNGGDWTLIALEAATLTFLCWFAVRAVRGRLRVALIADGADRGG